MVDLAVDVVAMFAYGGGLRSETQTRVHTNLRSVDKHRADRHWKREVHKAGAGPDAFRELRAQFPHHEPRD